MNLSLCMIVKNEEQYLEGCLRSVAGVVDEIIVVDTGSDDRTIEIAEAAGAKVFHFTWIGDFSAARNFSLEKASGRWILYLDADERLTEDSRPILKKLVSLKADRGILCGLLSTDEHGGRPNIMKYTRLFPNDKRVRFFGRVHEQIDGALNAAGYVIEDSAIRLIHHGYDIPKEEIQKKAKRNLDLLLIDYNEKPTGYLAFQIAQSYGVLEDKESACRYFEKALSEPSLLVYYRSHSLRYLAAEKMEKGNLNEAKILIDKALELKQEQPLIYIIASKIYFALKQKSQAEDYFMKGLEINNRILEGKIHPPFDILVDNKELLLHGIHTALENDSERLFIYVNNKIQSNARFSGDLRLKAELDLIEQIVKRSPIVHLNSEQIQNVVSEENLKAFYNLLVKNYYAADVEFFLEQVKPEIKDTLKYVYFRGDIAEQFGEYKKAEIFFNDAFGRNPNDISIGLRLISIYLRLGDMAGVQQILYRLESLENLSSLGGIITQLKEKLKVVAGKL